MKINDTEMKARFFAQYWGQKICCLGDDEETYEVSALLNSSKAVLKTPWYLHLKPLSSISYEDASAITIYSDYSKGRFNDYGFYNPTGFQFYSQNTVDFIRLKGYALPFMQYSVEQLVIMGWIKLFES